MSLRTVNVFVIVTALIGFIGFSTAGRMYAGAAQTEPALGSLGEGERLITILGTNDIHGGVEPETDAKTGAKFGGAAFFAGAAQAIRTGIESRYGARGGVLLVDAGDQFQGTLISNYDEGQLVFAAMNEAGYDAVVPGNHDYDFGPIGWLHDQVVPGHWDQNRRGALDRLVSQAAFPLLSANTFTKASLKTVEGQPVVVNSVGCRPEAPAAPGAAPAPAQSPIDWSRAERPPFLKPYLIKEVAGLRVALIGLDLPGTPLSTTVENVSDLCFRDELESYLEIRKEIGTRADLFVMVIHNGNTTADAPITRLVEKIAAHGPTTLHAVISGHTHIVNSAKVGAIPIIQSGSGGEAFGRVDLVWNPATGQLVPEKTRVFAGVKLFHDRCATRDLGFCSVGQDGQGKDRVLYDGVLVAANTRVESLIRDARGQVDILAKRKLGTAKGQISRNRILESPLANALTDALREVARVEVAAMNTGGIREDLKAGDILYEDFFRVLPFANHGVVVGPMKVETLLALLARSIRTCGTYGALMQSGLKVQFLRNCKDRNGTTDPSARLLRVETLGGELVFDESRGGLQSSPNRVFQVATLDFLAAGGSGYVEFIGTPVVSDLGIVREAMTEAFLAKPVEMSAVTDGRWKEMSVAVPRSPAPPLAPARKRISRTATAIEIRAVLR